MLKLPLRNGLLALCASVALAACGSSSSNDDAPPPPPVARTTDVPDSAQQSVTGLIAYLNDFIATMTSGTSEPILLGNATLPTSDTIEASN